MGDNKKPKQTDPFDQFIREVEKTHIPAEYIQQVIVYYTDGTTLELTGEQVLDDVVIYRNGLGAVKAYDNKISDVRIFINTQKLGKVINQNTNALFSKFNIL